MFNRRYPIMMGIGTKILTAYHHPTFKSGLMIAILHSKTKHKPDTQLTDKEFKDSASSIASEMYFDSLETLDRYIDNLVMLRDQWGKEVNEQ